MFVRDADGVAVRTCSDRHLVSDCIKIGRNPVTMLYRNRNVDGQLKLLARSAPGQVLEVLRPLSDRCLGAVGHKPA